MTARNGDQPSSRPSDPGYWAALRAKNGHPAPYNVPFWEVGNEQDGPGQDGWRSGSVVVSVGPHDTPCPTTRGAHLPVRLRRHDCVLQPNRWHPGRRTAGGVVLNGLARPGVLRLFPPRHPREQRRSTLGLSRGKRYADPHRRPRAGQDVYQFERRQKERSSLAMAPTAPSRLKAPP